MGITVMITAVSLSTIVY